MEIHRRAKAVEQETAPVVSSATEFLDVLEHFTVVAGDLSELLDAMRAAARRFGGPAAGVSFDVACRRAEQAFCQLEISLRDAREATEKAV